MRSPPGSFSSVIGALVRIRRSNGTVTTSLAPSNQPSCICRTTPSTPERCVELKPRPTTRYSGGPTIGGWPGAAPGGRPGASSVAAWQLSPPGQYPVQFVVPTKCWVMVPVKRLFPVPPRLCVISNSPLRRDAPGPVFSGVWER